MKPTPRILALVLCGGLLLARPAAAVPDLTCTITAVPNSSPGKVQLTVVIKNVGDTDAVPGDDWVGFIHGAAFAHKDAEPTLDDISGISFVLDTLKAGEEATVDLIAPGEAGATTEFPVDPGPNTAYATINVDYGGGTFPYADETNFDNNVCEFKYTQEVGPDLEPDIQVTNLTAGPSSECANPDLICTELTVTVENKGLATALGPFLVDVYALTGEEPTCGETDPDTFCEVKDDLGVDASAVVTCAVPIGFTGAGLKTIWTCADPPSEESPKGLIAESDETNNKKSFGLPIAGPPDLTVSDIIVAQEGGEGADVTYQVEVSNLGGTSCDEPEVRIFWQALAKPDPAADTPTAPPKTVGAAIAPGKIGATNFTQTGPIGGDWTVWACADCLDPSDKELDEDNNCSSADYNVAGIPNEPPVLDGIDGPDLCVEAGTCKWKLNITDTTAADPLKFEIAEGPRGMYVGSEVGTTNAIVYYSPPLGSTSASTLFKVTITDQAGATVTASKTFAIHPPPGPPDGFSGVVGEPNFGLMPNNAIGSACPMVEVPGNGFAFVETDKNVVRWYRDPVGAEADFVDFNPVWQKYLVPDFELSCHIEALWGGGYALLDTVNNVILLFGNDHKLLKQIDVNAVAPIAIYSDMFTIIAPSTIVLLDPKQSTGKLVFIDLTTGKLDETWGGNAKAELGTGTPGIMTMYDPGDAAMYTYDRYLCHDAGTISVYNIFHASQQLITYNQEGGVEAAKTIGYKNCNLSPDCEPLLPPGPAGDEEPNWVMLAAPDCGIQLVDYSTNTLQWYDKNLEPVTKFTKPPADAEDAWPVGAVSLAAEGLSVNNVGCEVLGSGGFTCQDKSGQNGFVIDGSGVQWKNCPDLDITPLALNFGGVALYDKKKLTLTLCNKGGGVLLINEAKIGGLKLGEGQLFSQKGLGPNSDLLLPPGACTEVSITYQPDVPGEHSGFLALDSNACGQVIVDVVGRSGPHIEITPDPIWFKGVAEGKHCQTVTIKSIGSDPLILSEKVDFVPPESNLLKLFSCAPSNVDGVELAPGATYDLECCFDAQAQGEYATALQVKSNSALFKPEEIDVFASTAPSISARPTGFNLHEVQVGSKKTATPVLIQNVGFSPITFEAPKLTGPPGFELDLTTFKPTLGYQEVTTLKLSYTPQLPGTAVAVVTLAHDDPNQAPYILMAVAGTGTELSEGFAGALFFADPDGPFTGPLDLGNTVIQLSTGGFAIYSETTGAIHVIDGQGAPDPWFGIGGKVQVIGPGGAFPDAVGLGTNLIELESGGFGMLAASEHRFYAIRPDGKPNALVGKGGVIDIKAVFAGAGTLSDSLIQLPLGAFKHAVLVVFDVDAEQLLVFRTDGTQDNTEIAIGGELNFLGISAIAGGGLATGTGDTIALSEQGGLILGDAETAKFYTLNKNGKSAIGESIKDVVPSFVGTLAACGDGTTAFLDPATGIVTRHDFPSMDLDTGFGDGAGQISFKLAYPDDGDTGAGLICNADGGWLAVAYAGCDCLRFTDFDGNPLALVPQFVSDLPKSLPFGVVPVGKTSAPQTITVGNGGSYPLIVSAIFSNGQFHLADGTKTVEIAPGDSYDLEIVFEPSGAGSPAETLVLTTNDPDTPQTEKIDLTGSTGPHLTVQPTEPILDFGNVVANPEKAPEKWLTFGNDGADTVTILSMVKDGPALFQKVTEINDNTTIAPDEVKTASYRCVPGDNDSGVHYGTVSIEHDDPSQPSPITITLVCRSSAQLKVEPAAVSCDNIGLGVKTLCGTVSLQNVGYETLTVYDSATTGLGFETVGGKIVLEPGDSPHKMAVTYQALKPGVSTGTLTLLHDDPASGGVTQVPLSAKVSSALSVNPPALDFGALSTGVSVSLPIELLNDGSAGSVAFIAATASGSAVFSVSETPETGTTIDAGGSVTIGVRCAPGDSTGEHKGVLTIATDAPGFGAITTPLTCVSGGHIIASPAKVDFGAVKTNGKKALPVTLKNIGIAPVELVSAIVGPAPEFTSFGLTDSTLGGGQETTISVLFKPAGTKDYSGTMTVSPVKAAQLEVPLSGVSGEKLALVATSNPLDFGVVALGSTQTRSVLVVNQGSTDIQDITIAFPAAKEDSKDTVGPFTKKDAPEKIQLLKPGQSQAITIEFSPGTVGNYETLLTANGAELTIKGRAGGLLVVTPAALAFGETPAGDTPTLPLVIANTSPSSSLEVSFFQSGDDNEFTLQGLDPAGATLAPGEVLEGVTVAFGPQTSGNFASTLTFFSTKGVEGGSIAVELTGRSGAQARLLYPPTGFHGFEAVKVNAVEGRPIRIAATGNASMKILGFTIEGDEDVFNIFGLDEKTGQAVITPGGVAELVVTCAPTEPGVYQGTVHLATDDAGTPDIPVKVVCRTPFAAIPSPPSLGFGGVAALATKTMTVTVTNKGSAVLLISGATVQGPPGFEVKSFIEDVGIQPNASIDIDVEFAPPASNAYYADLVIGNSDPVQGDLVVPLYGWAGPHASADTPVVNFCTSTSDHIVVVSNTGTSVLNVNDVTLTVTDADWKPPAAGDDLEALDWYWDDEGIVDEPETEFKINPGESRDMVLTYPPGNLVASVTGADIHISSDDPAGTFTIHAVVGDGIKAVPGFTGKADVGPPADTPAFPAASGLGAGLAELCTGGFATSGDNALFFSEPAAAGGATPLAYWGSSPGVTALQKVIENKSAAADLAKAGVDALLLEDLGSILATDGGTLILGSPSAGVYVFLRADGSLDTDAMPGGVLRLSDLLGQVAVAGAIAARKDGWIAVDRRSRQLIGITADGQLDTATFGPKVDVDKPGRTGKIALKALYDDPSATLGDTVLVIGGGTKERYAVSDGGHGLIYMVAIDGELYNETAGDSGLIDLTAEPAFAPGPFGIGGGMVAYDPGFGVLDQATGRLLFITFAGDANPIVTGDGIIQLTGASGAFNGAGALGVGLVVTKVSSEKASGKLVVLDVAEQDLLFADPDGTTFSFKAPELGVAPCPIAPIPVATGNATSEVITLSNTGDGFLTIESIDTGIATALPELGGAKITSGDPKAFTLSYTAEKAGCYQTNLVINHDGVNSPTICPVSLATLEEFQVTPKEEYEFPAQVPGTSFTKEFIVRNTGCQPFTLNNITLKELGSKPDDQFALKKGFDAPVPLGPSELHAFTVTCQPGVDGVHEANVNFETDGPTPSPVKVQCATGPLLVPCSGPPVWTLGADAETIQAVCIESLGGAEANITAITIVGDSDEAFTTVGPLPLGPLAIGATATASVQFAPSGPVKCPKTKKPRLVVEYDGQTLEIELCGDSAAIEVFEPTCPIDLGWVALDEATCQDVTISNAGIVLLEIDPQPDSLADTIFSWEPQETYKITPDLPKKATVCATATEAGEFEAVQKFEALTLVSKDDNDQIGCGVHACAGACINVDSKTVDFDIVSSIESDPSVLEKTLVFTNTGSVKGTVSAEFTAGAGAGAVFCFVNEAGECETSVDSLDIPPNTEGGDPVPVEMTLRLAPSPGAHDVTIQLTIAGAVCDCPTDVKVRALAGVTNDEDTPTDTGDDTTDTTDTGDEDLGTTGAGEGDNGGFGDDGGDHVEQDGPIADGGGGTDCGCDLAPSRKRSVPTGPAALILLLLLAVTFRPRRSQTD